MIQPLNPTSTLVFLNTVNKEMFDQLFYLGELYKLLGCEFHVIGVAVSYGPVLPPMLKITLRAKL